MRQAPHTASTTADTQGTASLLHWAHILMGKKQNLNKQAKNIVYFMVMDSKVKKTQANKKAGNAYRVFGGII